MSGAKRKGGYRKGVIDDYLNSYPEPENNERIALVCGSRGNNIFEISLSLQLSAFVTTPASPPSSSSSTTAVSMPSVTQASSSSSSVELAILPNKFKNVIWVKRGDFVIVSSGNESTSATAGDDTNRGGRKEKGDKVKFFIRCILNRDQIKHLKAIKKWPGQEDSHDATASIAGSNVIDGLFSDDLMPGYHATQEYEGEQEEEEDMDKEMKDATSTSVFTSVNLAETDCARNSGDRNDHT